MPTSSSTAATTSTTTIHDLPDAILSHILSTMLTDTRSRNAAALVCQKWLALERATRSRLSLRGNFRDLFLLPNTFRSVTDLDLSLLSPWGHPISALSSSIPLLAQRLLISFPAVSHLTIYSRSSPSALLCRLLSSPANWPSLSHLKFVRWHQRPLGPAGDDFIALFERFHHHGRSLASLDLSDFYCWTEDLPAALDTFPGVGRSLVRLDLMNFSFAEGFKSHEILSIVHACPNLREFRVACTFDPRYIGFIGDSSLLAISSNCKNLRVLHLADISANSRGGGGDGGDHEGGEEAGFTALGLIEFFGGLGFIEELVLDVCKNVRESWIVMDALATKCPNLRSLKLGHFHNLCKAIESQLDGLALCKQLTSLSIKNSADLIDSRLIAIARGCSVLEKVEIHGCNRVTMRGFRTIASLLRKTLVEVSISDCKNFNAEASLQAVDPIRHQIRRLHIDCIWENVGQQEMADFDLNEIGPMISYSNHEFMDDEECETSEGRAKRRKTRSCVHEANGTVGLWPRRWPKLEFFSMWIPVREPLTPLTEAGLEECPNLAEIHIKVEGDSRQMLKPSRLTLFTFGLGILNRFPNLVKMKLDLGDTIGYALTAPSGHLDLSLWERFYLHGITELGGQLRELDYWPPQDREVNQRSVSLPAVGLLAECGSLRKLFIHGTAHEHFMNFLLRIDNLRDVQLRGNYYPAPEDDMSTEMRVDSCCRFEDALNHRSIPD